MSRTVHVIQTAVVALGCAALQGCSPATVGVTGISVTADGSPVGVIQVCREGIDKAWLDQTASGSPVGRWTHTDAVTGFTSWPLITGGDGWTVREHPLAIEPNIIYHLYGGSPGDSGTVTGVDFNIDDLATLKPGQVRYYHVDDHVEKQKYVTTTVDTFRADACKWAN